MVTSQTEEKDKAEVETKAKAEAAEEQDKPEAEAKVEAEEKAKTETEAKPKNKAVEKKGKPEAKAKVEAEEKAQTKPKAKPKAETQEEKEKPKANAKVDAEEKAETETEAKPESEGEAAEKPKAEAEEKAKPEAKPKDETLEEKDKPKAEAKVEAEEKTETEEKTMSPDKSREYVVSEAIQKLTQSMTVPTDEAISSEAWTESGEPTMGTPQCGSPAHISVPSTVCTKDVMQKDVVWASPDESVQQALTKMQQHDCSYIIVGQDEELEGIVSKSDITGATSIYLRPIFAKWHGPGDDATLQIKLKWIMSRPVRTVSPEAPLATIIENMCRFGGRGLPVVDEQGKVQGLVTVFDIFRTLLNTSEDVSTVGKTAEAPALQ
jgi:CBS domain-containing protein